VYDPRLGRFLSADPFVQTAENLQSFNRYPYVMNNPLNATDPNGYIWQTIVIAVLEAYEVYTYVAWAFEIYSFYQYANTAYSILTAFKYGGGKAALGAVGNFLSSKLIGAVTGYATGQLAQSVAGVVKSTVSSWTSSDKDGINQVISKRRRANINPTAPTNGGNGSLFSSDEQDFLNIADEEWDNLPSHLQNRAEELIAAGELERAENMMDAWEAIYKSEQAVYTDGVGPGNAEAHVLKFENSSGEVTTKMVLFYGAFEAYRDGSQADTSSGYFIDLQPGRHAVRGLIGHEVGHTIERLNYDSNGNLLPGREGNAEKFLQDLYPNEYLGNP